MSKAVMVVIQKGYMIKFNGQNAIANCNNSEPLSSANQSKKGGATLAARVEAAYTIYRIYLC